MYRLLIYKPLGPGRLRSRAYRSGYRAPVGPSWIGRPRRDGSGNRWSSAATPRSRTTTTVSSWITTWNRGTPPMPPQLAKAVERVIARTGRNPRTVTADRGYGEQRVEDALTELGVRHVVIPRRR